MSARRPSQRFTTGVIVGFFAAAVAYATGGLPWAAVAGLTGVVIAVALT